MTQIILNSQCFEAGEELRINIQLKDTTPSSQRSSNINIDIIYIGEHRDIPRLMFSHTVDPQEPTLIIPRVITDDFETGLYQVRNLRFVHENGEKPVHIKSDGEDLLYFWVAPKQSYKLGKEQIIEKIKEVKVKQKQYAERSIYSKRCDEASHSSKFRVLIFGVGCLLAFATANEGLPNYTSGARIFLWTYAGSSKSLCKTESRHRATIRK